MTDLSDSERLIKRFENIAAGPGSAAELDDALTETVGRAMMLRAEILRMTVEREAALRQGTPDMGQEAALLDARIELAVDRWKRLTDLTGRLRTRRDALA